RNMVDFQEFFHLPQCPIKYWMYLDNLIGGIPFDEIHVFAIGRLLGANSGQPHFKSFNGALQGFYFTNITAFLSVLYTIVKTRRAFATNQLFYCLRIWEVSFDGKIISLESTIPNVVCFWK